MTLGPRLDLHVHTVASPDSRLTADDLVKAALVQGLDGVAVTDHNSTAGVAAVVEAARGATGFLVVPGVEISATEGHLLAYGVATPPAPHRPLAVLVEEVLRQGGVPVLAHPYRWAHGAGDRAARQEKVQGIETMNGRNSEMANAKAELVAAQRRLSATGGSDAHEPERVGRCFTRCEDAAKSVEEVLDLLRHGRTHAEGKSLGTAGRVATSLKNAGKRLGRGGSGI